MSEQIKICCITNRHLSVQDYKHCAGGAGSDYRPGKRFAGARIQNACCTGHGYLRTVSCVMYFTYLYRNGIMSWSGSAASAAATVVIDAGRAEAAFLRPWRIGAFREGSAAGAKSGSDLYYCRTCVCNRL